MNVTKYHHSCLVIESNEKVAIIDPGIFTFQEKVLDLSKLKTLDYICITHEHPDHFSIDQIKKIIAKFPNLQLITNESVQKLLEAEGINSSVFGNEVVSFENSPHEKLWDYEVQLNLAFTVFNQLTHPGDSLQISKTSEVLALPITAPWGSVTQAVEAALRLKPKAIIPIHDWHWKDEVRKEIYRRLNTFFSRKGITFYQMETGQPQQIDLGNFQNK